MTAPFIAPEFERHRPFLDSLFAVIRDAPDSIVSRSLRLHDRPGVVTEGFYDPDTRTVTISPQARNPKRTLAHELGHVLMQGDPEVFQQFLDSILRQPLRGARRLGGRFQVVPEQAEPFADAFADAFEALARGDTASKKRRIDFLMQILRLRSPFTAKEGKEPK